VSGSIKHDRQPVWRKPVMWLAAILIMQFILGTARIAAIPLWADHEADFFNVVYFTVQNRRLPAIEDYPAGDADIKQATQPPLHFLLMAPVMALFYQDEQVPPGAQPPALCFGTENFNRTQIAYPHTASYEGWPQGAARAGYALRFVSLICGLLTTIFVYAAGRVLAPKYAAIALGGAAMIAFEPSVMALNTTISNDASVMTVAAVNLLFALLLIQTRRWRYAAGMLIFAVFAILTRLPGWAVAGFSGLVLAFVLIRAVVENYRRKGMRVLLLPAAAVIIGIAGLAAVLAFNYSRSGSLFGRYAGQESQVLRLFEQPDTAARIGMDVLRVSLNEFGNPLSQIASSRLVTLQTTALLAGLTGAALLVLWGVIQSFRKRETPLVGGALALWAAALCGIGLVIVRNVITVEAWGGVTDYNFAAIYAPIRYYATALPPLALLVAIGFWTLGRAGLALFSRRLLPEMQMRLSGAAALLPATMGLALLLITGITVTRALAERPAVPTLTQAQFAALAGVTPVNGPDADGFPRIVGSRQQVDEDGLLQVTVYSVAPAEAEWNSALTLALGVDSCAFLPARGYSGTLVWQPGVIYALNTHLANCSNPEDEPLMLTAAWRGANLDGIYRAESPPVELGTVGVLSHGANCPANLGIIAGGYQIVRLNTPETAARGENYQPSLNWIVLHSRPDAYGRRIMLRHAETGAAFTCDFMDRDFTRWAEGEYVHFDRCPFTLPEDAPTGIYQILVVGLDVNGEPLPAVDGAGNAFPDNMIPVGQVVVT